jgi:hypothetical protein
MHDNPRASETEQEQAHEQTQGGTRQQEEEAMRGPEQSAPEQQGRPHAGDGDEER